MRMRCLATVLVCLPLLFAPGCGGGGGSSDGGAIAANTGLAIAGNFPFGLVDLGGLLFALVNEAEQNSGDLNGDGDAADNVVHMIDPVTGVVTNLGVSGTMTFARNDVCVAWAVSETEEGGTDLNGDGDAGDLVLAVYDPTLPVSAANPQVTSLSVSSFSAIEGSGTIFGFVSSELEDFQDLNADADLDDFVPRTFDVVSQTVFNPGLPIDPSAQVISLSDDLLVFGVDETSQTPAPMGDPFDLNGDMDGGDVVIAGFVPSTGVQVNIGPGGAVSRAIISGAFGIFGTVGNEFIAYSIDEAGEGLNINAFGLSNDIDQMDAVVAVFDVTQAAEFIPGGGIAVQAFRFAGSATHLVFSASEVENGDLGSDYNADADANDFVPFWVAFSDPATVTNVGIAQDDGSDTITPLVCDDQFVFLALEAEQGPNGTNYNAGQNDTDTSDIVPFFVDMTPTPTAPVNLGYAADQVICGFANSDFLVIIAQEADNGSSDYNQDGDMSDEITFYFRMVGGTIDLNPVQVRTGSGNISVQDCGTTVRFVTFAQEGIGFEFGDLNHDGDMDDFVLLTTQIAKSNGGLIGTETYQTVSSQVAEEEFPFLIGNSGVAFPFLESDFNFGLNLNFSSGDADTVDSVLMILSLNCP